MSTRLRITLTALCATAGGALLVVASALAAFPGANGRIAFVHDPGVSGTSADIFAFDATGQDVTQLTNGPGDDFDPTYSADGETIAFSRFPPGSSNGQIWVMNHDGSGETQLTSGTPSADDVHPAFSPDGEKIAFQRHDGSTRQIWMMNADGSGQTQLTFSGPGGDEAIGPSFSPDGQMIVFRRDFPATGFSEIWVMNADGSGQARLTSGSATSSDGSPDFSPDGQRIVSRRSDGSTQDLWIMNANGSGQSQLTSGADQDSDPAFAPDGARVAFGRQDPGFTSSNIVLVGPSGLNQNPTQLTGNAAPVLDFSPDWQPLNPPACELTGKASSKSVKRVRLTVTCANENATAVAEGSGKAPKLPKLGAIASKAKRFRIPAVTAQVPEDSPTTLTLKIPKKGRKALEKATKAGKKGKATITATLTDDLGQSSTDGLKVRFKK